MPQQFKPCCNNTQFEVVDAPRTEGANAPEDVIRCASCGGKLLSRAQSTQRSLHLSAFFHSLATRIAASA